jgi:putative transposase
MARPPRIELAGAVYYVTTRSAGGRAIFADDDDRQSLLDVLAQSLQRFDAQALAYCLLTNHFHLLLFTRQANLSRLMRHLNGVYTQLFNRRHGTSGPLFQGRFKAVIVDRDAWLLEACRYIELNALRLGVVAQPADWPWSSFPAHAGLVPVPDWLEQDGLYRFVLGHAAETAAQRRRAAQHYAKLLQGEPRLQLWPGRLRQQIYLGDAGFVGRVQQAIAANSAAIPARPERPVSWAEWERGSLSRPQALYRAHTEGGAPMTALARLLGLSVSRISRLISAYEQTGAV